MDCKHGVPDNVSCWICRGDAVPITHVAELIEERDVLTKALKELCELKIIKDTDGKTADYVRRRSDAWTAANQALNKFEL